MPEPRPYLTETELREGLRACLSVERWVDDVVAQGPFSSLVQLLGAARSAATPLAPAEIDEAMAAHPRIGDRPTGDEVSDRFSRAEQAASDSADQRLGAAIAAGNRAYEERFDRVFLIRAAGRSRAEILAELQRRLELDPERELGIVACELREIALLRIRQLFGHLDPE